MIDHSVYQLCGVATLFVLLLLHTRYRVVVWYQVYCTSYNSNLIIGTQAQGAETCVNLFFTLNESSELPGVCSPGKIGSFLISECVSHILVCLPGSHRELNA